MTHWINEKITDWIYGENEQNIKRSHGTGCFLSLVMCIIGITCAIYVFTIPMQWFFYAFTPDTHILESTSPDGEHTLIVTHRQVAIFSFVYQIELESDSTCKTTVSGTSRVADNSVSIEWYEQNKAMIEFKHGPIVEYTATEPHYFIKKE